MPSTSTPPAATGTVSSPPSTSTPEEPSSSVQPSTAAEPVPAVSGPRTRYLRACDTCRARKVRCDNNDPCEQCAKHNLECTFNADLKLLASSTCRVRKRPRTARKRSASVSSSNTSSKKLQAGANTRDNMPPHPKAPAMGVQDRRIECDWASHWFVGSDGLPRLTGVTSGLPMFDAALHVATSSTQWEPDNERDWGALSNMLLAGEPTDNSISRPQQLDGDEGEFFPDRQTAELRPPPTDYYTEVTGVIPEDLLAILIPKFFEVVHACWPIIHPPTFLEQLYRWDDPGCAALAVSMCMLASRYTCDPRVLSIPSDPSSAGRHYHDLFVKLTDLQNGHSLYELIAFFFASQFFCTDNVPTPLAHTYFSIALSKTIDGGVHKYLPASIPLDENKREMRKRAAWAVFCLDKQYACLSGRHPLLSVMDMSLGNPAPFVEDSAATAQSQLLDRRYIEIFEAFVSVSCVLDYAVKIPLTVVHDWDFLNDVTGQLEADNVPNINQHLEQTEKLLAAWRRQLPPSLAKRSLADRFTSPLHSAASEQVASTETLISLILYHRRMHYSTIHGPGINEDETRPHSIAIGRFLRDPVLKHAREMINSCIQMGAIEHLGHLDMLVVYHADREYAFKIRQSINAASILLHRLVTLFPAAIGAAETFDEMCRVCSIPVQHSPDDVMLGRKSQTLWYRPIRARARSTTTSQASQTTGRTPVAVSGGCQMGDRSPIEPTQAADTLSWLTPWLDTTSSIAPSALAARLASPSTTVEDLNISTPDLTWLIAGAQNWSNPSSSCLL